MTRANLHGEDWDDASTRPGFSWRAARIGRRIGGQRIGGTVYALDDGERSFPYHYHHGVEEWCYVIEAPRRCARPWVSGRCAPATSSAFGRGRTAPTSCAARAGS